MGAQHVVRHEIGDDFLNTFSQHMMRRAETVVDEFVINPFDHDAKTATVEATPRMMRVTDTGVGMSPDQVPNFFRLGDSVKVDKPISPGGRIRCGKFGYATLLANAIGRQLDLRTVRDGWLSHVEADYSDGFTPDIEYPFDPVRTDAPNGTVVTVNGLRSEFYERFDPEKFLTDLAWRLPIGDLGNGDSFNVTLNGVAAEPRPEIGGTRFIVNEHDDLAGRVNGTLHYFRSAHEHPRGIHLYVNRRRVGDPVAFARELKLNATVFSRMVGIINIDDFNPDVMFDRGQLRHTPAYDAMQALVRNATLEVRTYHEWYEKASVGVTSTEAAGKLRMSRGAARGQVIRHALNQALAELQGAGVIPQGRVKKRRFTDAEKSREGEPLLVRRGELAIHHDHPFWVIGTGEKAVHLRDALVSEIVYAMAVDQAREIGSEDLQTVNNFRRQWWDMIGTYRRDHRLKPIVVTPAESLRRVFPRVRYGFKELVRQSGETEPDLNYIINRRGLPSDAQRGVIGGHYLELVDATKLLVPLPRLFEEGSRSSQGQRVRRLHDALESICETAPDTLAPFVLDYGQDGEHCFYADPLFQDSLMQLQSFDSEAITDLIEDLRRPWSVRDLGKLKIMSQSIGAATTYAEENGLPLEKTPEGQYLPEQLLRVFQHRRGNHIPSFEGTYIPDDVPAPL